MGKTLFFETIKAHQKKIFNLSYHEKRIFKTIKKEFSLENLIAPPSENLYRIKVIYSKDKIESIEYHPYIKKNPKTFELVYDNTIDYSSKYLKREKLERTSIADEIIFIKDNLVSDTRIANIAIYIDNVWLTPKKPLLEGTTRQRYIENQIIQPYDINVELLTKSSKLALLNSMIDFYSIENFILFNNQG